MTKDFKATYDGLSVVELDSWSLEKLHFLNRLIDIFTVGMKNKFSMINFINLFCGPGMMLEKSSGQFYYGSPMIAWRTDHPFTHYYFCDNDPLFMRDLEQRCNDSQNKANYYCEDANVAVGSITADINYRTKEVGSSLNLAFMDQFSFELQWPTIESLSHVGRMDLLIYYPESAINRNLEMFSKQDGGTAMDTYFGSHLWREIVKSYPSKRPGELTRPLMDFYKQNLRKLGYRAIETYEPGFRGPSYSIIYRLLFASKHPRGADFWNKATNRALNGQIPLPL